MDASETHKNFQSVIVMRHGDLADNFERYGYQRWQTVGPHLIEEGWVRAFFRVRRLRTNLGFPIRRVFVAPFLRSIQTAYEVVFVLLPFDDDPNAMSCKDVSLDPSKIKSKEAIRNKVAPKDRNFGFNTSVLEALLPAGPVERVREQSPKWEMPLSGARERYKQMIKALADNTLLRNMLLVTHGKGKGAGVGLTSAEGDSASVGGLANSIGSAMALSSDSLELSESVGIAIGSLLVGVF